MPSPTFTSSTYRTSEEELLSMPDWMFHYPIPLIYPVRIARTFSGTPAFLHQQLRWTDGPWATTLTAAEQYLCFVTAWVRRYCIFPAYPQGEMPIFRHNTDNVIDFFRGTERNYIYLGSNHSSPADDRLRYIVMLSTCAAGNNSALATRQLPTFRERNIAVKPRCIVVLDDSLFYFAGISHDRCADAGYLVVMSTTPTGEGELPDLYYVIYSYSDNRTVLVTPQALSRQISE